MRCHLTTPSGGIVSEADGIAEVNFADCAGCQRAVCKDYNDWRVPSNTIRRIEQRIRKESLLPIGETSQSMNIAVTASNLSDAEIS